MDFAALNACASNDTEGWQYLKQSVQRSNDAGVVYSCTVRLQDKIRCIRDGGEWKDCSGGSGVADLVADVETLYHGL